MSNMIFLSVASLQQDTWVIRQSDSQETDDWPEGGQPVMDFPLVNYVRELGGSPSAP